ncbi:NAD-dependent epimerase/dehydratase family protein [Carboxylicivirga sp. A043]|uniref:NAD-dependent epimerase/dehydratase family protein n=1 Tax=Carboxylicivirga litoralis TaxID=2816963 RepID=UPI0021CAE73D|nr:NAD-dependent epimerase/dehydratase family protein [Carboxylicivirga sp. A043]MCU4158210.1 NAD-dependent epimerase/dehydratase family protein [Carboxylicivirga sp. A043]
MKFIIFGSEGFIGTHFKNYIEGNNLGEIVKYDMKRDAALDVREKIEIEGDFTENDIIINLAAVHTTPGHPDYEYFETNILGAENICEFAEQHGIKTIVFTSSIAPYGASEQIKKESTLPTPNTPYGISKLVAENIHKTWQARESNKRKLLILRPGVVFGKGENGNFTRLYKALAKGVFFYPGRTDTIKGCVYVKDLVDMTYRILNGFSAGVQLYNFTYYPEYTIKDIVQCIARTTDLSEARIKFNGKVLMILASIIGAIGGKHLGIHPDRIKKLMISTNVSGEKLSNIVDGKYKYGFEGGINDWFIDCNNEGLF